VRFSFAGEGCFPTGKHYPGIAHLLRVAAAGLAEEFDALTDLADLTLVSIDTETTGRNAQVDRIVELACVVVRGGQIIESHTWLINPERPIPQEAFDVHGISDADVRDKPVFRDVLPEILEKLRDLVPVAYNAEFDQAFLQAEFERAGVSSMRLPPTFRKGVRFMDPLVFARELHKDAKSKALGAMSELLGITLERAHRATDDAAAAALVLLKFFEDVRVPKRYGAFMQEQQRLNRLQAEERQYWRNP
jgi:DNA polymerase III subunit epsilon